MALIWNPFISLKMSGYWDGNKRKLEAIVPCYGCSQASPCLKRKQQLHSGTRCRHLGMTSLSAARSAIKMHSLHSENEFARWEAPCWSVLFSWRWTYCKGEEWLWEAHEAWPSCPSCWAPLPGDIPLTHPGREGREAFPGPQTIPTNWLFNWLSMATTPKSL